LKACTHEPFFCRRHRRCEPTRARTPAPRRNLAFACDDYEASIHAYLDPPKTLEELQSAASESKKGYEIHHIVEQKSAEDDKFPRSMIDAPDNLARIPKFKHWQITGWHMTRNRAFGNVPPREYLRGKGWDERTRIGLDALRQYGVLKP
jgi:hypothetical protein